MISYKNVSYTSGHIWVMECKMCKFKNPAFQEDRPEASHTCKDTEEHGRTLDKCWRKF